MSSDAQDPIALDPETFGTEQPCFGCAPDHPIGLRLRFHRHGDQVITRWLPGERFQGPPRIVHGGLVVTLADEIAAWTIVALKGQLGFTAKMECRLRAPVRIGDEVIGRGRIDSDGDRVIIVAVELEQQSRICFEGRFTFAVLDESGAKRLLGKDLPEAWQRFCR